jgi:polysaccharide biosynthesis PFTS motif protein
VEQKHDKITNLFLFISRIIQLSLSLLNLFAVMVRIKLKNTQVKDTLKSHGIIVFYTLSEEQIDQFVNLFKIKKNAATFPIEIIRETKFFLIQSKKTSFKCINNRFIITGPMLNLYFYILLKSTLNISLKKIWRMNHIKLLDLIGHEVTLQTFVTNSCLGEHPYNLSKEVKRNYVTNCLHYSENSLPIGVGKNTKLPNVEWLTNESSDVQWVWSEGFANYIRSVNSKTIVKAVGVIDFQFAASVRRINILVFNSTPARTSYPAHELYTVDSAIKFISDIVTVTEKVVLGKEDVEIKILVKPKRKYGKIHSQDYIKFLIRLQEDNKIVILDGSSNYFEHANLCDLIISIPYTTAAQIGNYLGVESVYYNPLNEKLTLPRKTDVRTIESVEDLNEVISRLV